MFILNSFLSCVVTLKCSPIFPNSLKKLWNRFENLEQYAGQCLQINWSFRQISRNLFIKYVVVAILFGTRIITKIYLRASHSFLSRFIHYPIIAVTFCAIMHATLYIESLHFIMKTINKHLSKSLKNANNSSAAFKLQDNHEQKTVDDIEVYKNIYYKIWQISKLINENFGWIFICYFMQMLNNVLKLATWIVIDIYQEDLVHEYEILSKFNLFINLFFLILHFVCNFF